MLKIKSIKLLLTRLSFSCFCFGPFSTAYLCLVLPTAASCSALLLYFKMFFAFSVRHISEYANSILPITEILSCWKKRMSLFR